MEMWKALFPRMVRQQLLVRNLRESCSSPALTCLRTLLSYSWGCRARRLVFSRKHELAHIHVCMSVAAVARLVARCQGWSDL
eukprot:6491046-Amphidinium_carterae.4